MDLRNFITYLALIAYAHQFVCKELVMILITYILVDLNGIYSAVSKCGHEMFEEFNHYTVVHFLSVLLKTAINKFKQYWNSLCTRSKTIITSDSLTIETFFCYSQCKRNILQEYATHRIAYLSGNNFSHALYDDSCQFSESIVKTLNLLLRKQLEIIQS